ncbi:MAG: hypothetical protein KDD94_08290 [Calditrichaeota bacterium]|nr:hypothetical protein [Calditrichota bacterium]
MSIRVEDDKRNVLKAIASLEGKTIGGLVGELIDDYIRANKEKLLIIQENKEEYGLMNLSQKSFDEWDNEEDAIYDDL